MYLPTLLEAGDDGANETTLDERKVLVIASRLIALLSGTELRDKCREAAVRTWTPSGLIAMKLEVLVSICLPA